MTKVTWNEVKTAIKAGGCSQLVRLPFDAWKDDRMRGAVRLAGITRVYSERNLYANNVPLLTIIDEENKERHIPMIGDVWKDGNVFVLVVKDKAFGFRVGGEE